jgi:hypothetical protein
MSATRGDRSSVIVAIVVSDARIGTARSSAGRATEDGRGSAEPSQVAATAATGHLAGQPADPRPAAATTTARMARPRITGALV